MVIFGIWLIQKLKIEFKLDNVRKIIFKHCFFVGELFTHHNEGGFTIFIT